MFFDDKRVLILRGKHEGLHGWLMYKAVKHHLSSEDRYAISVTILGVGTSTLLMNQSGFKEL